jgi:trimeric autotransporter adhesin
MSTKTTFKRVALVAVAALGLGVLTSVAPASAAVQSDALTLSATTGTAVIGETATVAVSLSFLDTDASAESMTATAVVLSSPATSTLIPAFSITGTQSSANTAGTTAASGTVMTLTSTAAGRSTGSATLSLVNVAVAGTYVIRITPAGGLTTTAQTWTVTVSAKVFAKATAASVGNTAGSTLVYGPAYNYSSGGVNYNSMGGTYADPDAASTAALVTAGGVSCYSPLGFGNPCLIGRIVLSNGSTVAADQMTSAQAEALTYKVTGPGVISLNKSDQNWTSALPAGGTGETTETTANGGVGTPTSLTKTFLLYTTGAPGKITVTITSGTTPIATVSAIAFGDVATITPTVVNNPIVKSATNSGTITALVKDSEGSLVRGAQVFAVSSDTTVISNNYTSCGTTTSTGSVTCNLVAAANAGTANITLTTNSSATATGGISATPVAVRVSDGVPTKVAYTFDKESYAPGETAKITATVSNAGGVMPAASYTVLTAGVTANYTVSGLPTTTVLAVLNTGAATYTVTIPTGVTGDLELTGTAATGITATFGKAAVVNVAYDAAQAATDAAAEATDAANAATDAANAAAEAADAATAAAQDAADAVAALATQVTEMVNALKKQITALTNLVIKIQKKVKA